MFKKGHKHQYPVEAALPDESVTSNENITLEGDSVTTDEVADLAPNLSKRQAMKQLLETQDCKCDHSTRASGFCKHGNNI